MGVSRRGDLFFWGFGLGLPRPDRAVGSDQGLEEDSPDGHHRVGQEGWQGQAEPHPGLSQAGPGSHEHDTDMTFLSTRTCLGTKK